jgi:hypothetical protein
MIHMLIIIIQIFMHQTIIMLHIYWMMQRLGMDCADMICLPMLALECYRAIQVGTKTVHHDMHVKR